MNPVMDRRDFLRTALAAPALAGVTRGAAARPRIVLRSSWQTINIGDIGHTPGVLAILERLLQHHRVVAEMDGLSRDIGLPGRQACDIR